MLSDYIPENVVPSVKCFYIGKLVLGSVDIVVCTDTGYVVEFSNYKIKKKCSFSCCDAESIVPFSSYDPNHNFYIIKAKNVLVVVIRGEKLKLLESYTSVQKFAIRDFSGKGFPMVGIWIKTSKTPDIITNFADKTEVPGKEKANLLSGFLVDKLQEIRKITCESQLKLAEKQELRLKCTNNLEETLTKKFQPEMQDGSTADERLSEVHIANHWHRLHNGKWVLGTTIRNRSNRKLFAIKMMLSCDDEPNLCYCTRVVQFQETTQWNNSEILSANTTGHVLTILEVPCFKSHMVKISATIMCKMESEPFKELQLYVPPYELNAEDVAKNLNTTFSKHEDTEDVLSVLAASEKIMLTAKWQRAEIQLQDVLVTKLNFVDQTGVGYFYNSGKDTPGLAGIMVEMVQQTDTDYTINVFSRNAQQLYLFVSMVYDVVPLDTVAFLLPEKPKFGCDMLREAFSEELKLVKALMPEDAMACDSDDVVISCDRYSSFRKQFSCLELSTDMLASGNYQPDV